MHKILPAQFLFTAFLLCIMAQAYAFDQPQQASLQTPSALSNASNTSTGVSPCFNFEDITVPSADKQHTFAIYGNGNTGFLQDWEVTNGTPSIYGSGDGFGSANSGNQFIFLGVDNTVIGEGLAVKYNFAAGKSYTIRLARRNAVSGKLLNVDYVLLKNPINYTYNYNVGATAIPAIPSTNALQVSKDSALSSAGWDVLTITTPVLSEDYSRLWFRPSWTEYNQGQVFMLIDDVCIEENTTNDCYSFEDITVPSNSKQHTFATYGNGNAGFLQNWEVTNGTPSVYSSTDGFGVAYDGDQYVFLGVDNTTIGEGVALKYNFEAGKAYNISLARRNAVQGKKVNVDYVLLDGAISYTYNYNVGASAVPSIPVTGSLQIGKDSALTSAPWQVLNITTPVLTQNFSRIWFRPSWTASNQGQVFFLMDSICITEQLGTGIIQVNSNYNSRLKGNYPNPFSSTTTISYYLDGNASNAAIHIYNLQGQLLLQQPIHGAGEGQLSVDAASLLPGIYFYALVINNQPVSSHKMVVQY